jgi:hypothetical protein
MIRPAYRSIAKSFVAAVALLLPLACSEAKNTPEEAFQTLTTALSGQKWDLLYDILPVDEQKHWDERIESVLARNEASNELLARLGLESGGSILDELKLTKEQWVALPQKEKFVRVFGLNSKINLGELGIVPEHVVGAKVKSTVISGDRAEIVTDDGKGHNKRLIFRLADGYWRFQLSGD